MLMYMLSPSLLTLTVSVVGVHAAIRTGLFTPDKAFEVVVRKRIVSLKAPTDLVVRLVTEEVLKICQAGFAQVTNCPFTYSGASAWGKRKALHRHVMFLRSKSTAWTVNTLLIGFLCYISFLI